MTETHVQHKLNQMEQMLQQVNSVSPDSDDPQHDMETVLASLGLEPQALQAVCQGSDEEFSQWYQNALRSAVSGMNKSHQLELDVIPGEGPSGAHLMLNGGNNNNNVLNSQQKQQLQQQGGGARGFQNQNQSAANRMQQHTNQYQSTMPTADRLVAAKANHHPVFHTPPEFDGGSPF